MGENRNFKAILIKFDQVSRLFDSRLIETVYTLSY